MVNFTPLISCISESTQSIFEFKTSIDGEFNADSNDVYYKKFYNKTFSFYLYI